MIRKIIITGLTIACLGANFSFADESTDFNNKAMRVMDNARAEAANETRDAAYNNYVTVISKSYNEICQNKIQGSKVSDSWSENLMESDIKDTIKDKHGSNKIKSALSSKVSQMLIDACEIALNNHSSDSFYMKYQSAAKVTVNKKYQDIMK